MEASYRKNKIYQAINRVMDKMENLIDVDDEEKLALRIEFENIKKDIYKA